jgi:outer membrane immunogenic protein
MRNRLMSGFAGAAFSFAASGFAFAADMAVKMPVKAPPPPPAPVYSWTGWYVGGNVGYSWGDAHTDIAGSGSIFTTPDLVPGFPGFPSSVGFADSNTARLNGVIGGGQIGYNYQFSPKWVLGFETDIQASGERGSGTFVDPFSTQICNAGGVLTQGGVDTPFCAGTGPLNGTAVTAYEARIDWLGTVRGRLGYLVNDQVLLYGTGGLAYGRVKLSGVTNVNGTLPSEFSNSPFPFDNPAASAFSKSRTNIGWTAGAGIEGRFAYWLSAGWTWKLEYLYLDLGSLDTTAPFPPAVASTGHALQIQTTPFTGPLTTHTHFTDNIVRVGLNYQFH